MDVDGEKNGGQYPTRYYRLDYRDAVPLHQRGCYEKPQTGSYYYNLQNVSDGRFEPTRIFLDNPALPNPKFNPTFHMYRPTIDTLRNNKGLDSLYALKTVVIRNWYSLLKIKEIEILQPFYIGADGFKKILEFSDFLDRNPTGILDFRIWVKRVKNDLNQFEDYYDYYCYNPKSEIYERHPALSDYPNIHISGFSEPIQRKSTGMESGKIFERFFVLTNDQWVLTNEIFHIPNPPVIQEPTPSSCVQWIDSRSHLSKVHFHSNQEVTAHVTHRFRYLNTCDKSYLPLPFRSSHDPYFIASKKVHPNDTGFIAFDATIAAYSAGLQPITHMAYAPTTDNPHFTVDIEFFVAYTEWVTSWHANGIPSFVMVQRSDGLANALVIDEEGYPLEHGTYYPRDEKKIGNWVQYNRGGTKSYRKYGCLVHLNISWPTQLDEEVFTWVFRNGNWLKQETTLLNGDRKMYLYESIDSIMVTSGQGVFKQKIEFDQLSNENWLPIHLLFPDQIPLPIGMSLVGINITEYTFGIEWDRIYISNQPQFRDKNNDELLQEFLLRHPMLRIYSHPCKHCQAITLHHLSPLQRSETLQAIVQDSLIRHIAQAFIINRGAETFFHGEPSIRVNYNLSYAQIQAKLEGYGFIYKGPMHGATGIYQVEWPDKVLGTTYIQTLRNVFQDPDVSMVSSPCYFEPSIDSGLKESFRE